MQVHMVMRVDVIQNQPCLVKRVKLRSYLRLDLFANPRVKEKPETRPREMRRECLRCIYQVRDLLRGQDGCSFHQCQMEPDP